MNPSIPALLAAALALSSHANAQSYRTVVFSRAGLSAPWASSWTGSAWTSPVQLGSVGAEPHWLVVESCPTRNEMLAATLDSAEDVNVQFRRSGAFTAVSEATNSGQSNQTRGMDMVYEQESGDALMVYLYSNGANIGYRTCAGGPISDEIQTFPAANHIRWVKLTAIPGTDRVLLLFASEGAGLCAAFWNGTAWGTHTVLAEPPTFDAECFGAAVQQVSGRVLVVYGKAGTDAPLFRTHNGTAWSAEQSMPSIGATVDWVSLAARPDSDDIVLAVQDHNKQVHLNFWNGTSWGSHLTVSTDTGYDNRRMCDVAYEPDGSHAVAVYSTKATTPKYRVWNGSAWSAQASAPDLGQNLSIPQLTPGDAGSHVFLLCSDAGDDLSATIWNGTSFSSPTQIEGSLGGSDASEAFMLEPGGGRRIRIRAWQQTAPE